MPPEVVVTVTMWSMDLAVVLVALGLVLVALETPRVGPALDFWRLVCGKAS